ncbi:MAG: ABC transporter ATP-binding protein [Sulfurospirillaceae bacterium]|nr:ABC transporter ATP-binding protein [Sulfurospirillaceae bacterium]
MRKLSNLDMGYQTRLLDIMSTLRRQGCSILMATHCADHALMLCDKVVWIDKQSIVAQGIPKAVCHVKRFQKIYGISTQIVKDTKGSSHLVPLKIETPKKFAS